MTNEPSPAPLSKRILSGVLSAIVIIAIIAAVIISNRKPDQAHVIAAVRADFPTFCANGQILTNNEGASHWGIKCDSWLKDPTGFYGDVTIMDVDHCTTMRPLIGTLGEYYNQFEAINKTNGQKLAVCP